MADTEEVWASMQASERRVKATRKAALLAANVYGGVDTTTTTKKKATTSQQKKRGPVPPGEKKKKETAASVMASMESISSGGTTMVEKTSPETTEEALPSAVEVIRRTARAVNELSDESSCTRGRGLDALCALFTGKKLEEWPEATLSAMLDVASKPLLKRFEDPVEKYREKAIDLYSNLASKVRDVSKHMPFLFPMLVSRSTPAVGLDQGLGIFVLNADEVDAYKRGKAVSRPDLALANERIRVGTVTEPSEELRLKLFQLVQIVTLKKLELVQGVTDLDKRTLEGVVPYFHEAILCVAGAVRDPYPSLLVEACDGVSKLCSITVIQDVLVPYAAAFARVCMPNLRHRHAKVRAAAMRAVWKAVSVKFVAKQRGAGTDALVDLVGFREDNVIPTASFYEQEVRYNYVADLTRDSAVSVRRALSRCLADWFVALPDRRDHQPRLMAYVLNCLVDADSEVRSIAFDALNVAGKEWESERDERVVEKRQYGVDGDARCNHDPTTLPWPFPQRPQLGARLLVRAFAHRFLKPALAELSNWRADARRQSCVLVKAIVVYCEDHLTQDLDHIVQSVCKSLKLIRREQYTDRDDVLDICRVLGRYVVPESFAPFLAPRISGDVELFPSGTDSYARADCLAVLACFIDGAKPATILANLPKLTDLFTHSSVVAFSSPELASSAASALARLLKVLQDKGRAPLEAVFVATGRLGTLDTVFASLLKALLSWRCAAGEESSSGGTSCFGAHISSSKERCSFDAALELLAAIDVDPDPQGSGLSGTARLVLRRAPQLFAELRPDECALTESVEYRVLEQSLALAGPGESDTITLGPCARRGLESLLRAGLSVARTVDNTDPFDDDGDTDVVKSLARALCQPLRLAALVQDDDNYRQLAAQLVTDLILPETRWDVKLAQSRAAVLAASMSLLNSAAVEQSSALPLATILVQALHVDKASKRDNAAFLDALAVLLGLLHRDQSKQSRRKMTRLAVVDDDVVQVAQAAHRAAWLFIKHTGPERDAALAVLWELAYMLPPADASRSSLLPSYDQFVVDLLPLLAPDLNVSDDPVVLAFQTQVDALLRALAVIDPQAFTACLANAPHRTNTIAALEDHASLLLMLRSTV